jgi:hypothetical protein
MIYLHKILHALFLPVGALLVVWVAGWLLGSERAG